MLKIKYLILSVILIVFSQIPKAQIIDLKFQHITTSQGLSSSDITSIIEDNKGFIWIGTKDGLNRFDGYNIRVYKNKIGDSTSIINNGIFALFVDSKNRLWAATLVGICLYNDTIDSFSNFYLNKYNLTKNISNKSNALVESAEGNVFTIAEEGILYVFNEKSFDFESFTSFNFGVAKSMAIDKENIIWIGSSTGLYSINLNTKEISEYSKRNDFPVKEQFTINTISIVNNQVWCGTERQGLILYSKKDNNFNTIDFKDLALNFINQIYKDTNGTIWIANNSGFIHYSYEKNTFLSFYSEKNNPFGLWGDGVKAIFEDKQHNIWLGTEFGGINLLNISNKFYHYNSSFSSAIRLSEEIVSEIAQDSKGNIWLGYFSQGIDLVNFKTGYNRNFTRGQKNCEAFCRGSIFKIFESSDSKIWTGGYFDPLCYFDPKTQKFEQVFYKDLTNNELHPFFSDIRDIAENPQGVLWIVSHGHGIARFDTKSQTIKTYKFGTTNPLYSIADDFAFTLLFDHRDSLWVGTPSGLSMINTNTGVVTNYYQSDKYLSSNYIICLFEDSKNNLWVGTQNGLNKYISENKTFKHYMIEDGLPNNVIQSISEDLMGNLWFSTNMGLSKFNPETGKFRNYDIFDGLQANEFFPRASLRDKDGYLYFGGLNGLTKFYPDSINDNTYIPPVYIIDIKLFNKSITIPENKKNEILTKNVTNTNEITLKYHQNVITIEYVALNFVKPQKNQYAYILEGFENEWNYVGTKREVTYTNLDPGKYTFRVIASNNDGIWNKTGNSIIINVLPPFWMSIAFKIIVGISILLLIYLVFIERSKKYRKQKKQLEEKIKARTLDLSAANDLLKQQQDLIIKKNYDLELHKQHLESIVKIRTTDLEKAKKKAEEADKLKSAFLANMSHEIRTPMNAIIGFLNLLKNDDIDRNTRDEFINVIIKNSDTLLQLIDDIIDLSKIEAEKISIDNNACNINNTLQDVYTFFQGLLAEGNDISKILILEPFPENTFSPNQPLIVETDVVRFKQVLTNLIDNAIKYTEKGEIRFGYKFVKINLQSQGFDFLQFHIKDTGIGIPKEKQQLVFERFRKIEPDNSKLFRGTGLGLSISKALVNLLGGEIWLESLQGQGTCFYFTIPLIFPNIEIPKALKTNQIAPNSYPDLQNYHILVVEDEEENKKYLNMILSKTFVKMTFAENGSQALYYLQNTKFDLILMDIKMPGLNGYDLLRIIREKYDKQIVVAQTAYAMPADREKIQKAGFDNLIVKPYKPAAIINIINQYLK